MFQAGRQALDLERELIEKVWVRKQLVQGKIEEVAALEADFGGRGCKNGRSVLGGDMERENLRKADTAVRGLDGQGVRPPLGCVDDSAYQEALIGLVVFEAEACGQLAAERKREAVIQILLEKIIVQV